MLAWGVWGRAASVVAEEPAEIDFDRQIKPILSNHCFQCHGPDEANREAGLRLDQREAALAPLASGERAIVPKSPENSGVIARIQDDGDLQMPPPELGKPLTAEQKALLTGWIAQGARYAQHWAFVVPQRPPAPEVKRADWCRNLIDRFVLRRLEAAGLEPAPQAPPHTLARRLALDLTGLPPDPEMVAALGQQANKPPSESSYEQLVDRLLASPQFGERMAMFWLDAARYSDTDGFQGDAARTNWPWRDWVVDAFNRNVPFDQFTREQFAGDLLEQPTAEQRLATCFHRNHMTNGEGGRDREESRIDYVLDRVNTVGTVWLGMTLGCCQCHSHKYDPITQTEYYRLFAFFDSIDEDGSAGSRAKPYLSYQSPRASAVATEAERWLAAQQQREAAVKRQAERRFAAILAARLKQLARRADAPGEAGAGVPASFRGWHPVTRMRLASAAGTELVQEPDGTIVARGPDPHHEDYQLAIAAAGLPVKRVTGVQLEVFPAAEHTANGYSRSATGHFIVSDIKLRVRSRASATIRDVAIAQAVADYSADPGKNGGYGDVRHTLDDDPRNGWASFGAEFTEPRRAIFALDAPLVLQEGDELLVELQQRALQGRHNLGRFRLALTEQAGETPTSLQRSPLEELAELRPADAAAIPAPLRARLLAQFLADDPPYVAIRQALERARAQLDELRRGTRPVNVMVLAQRAEPRTTHLLLRGVWNAKGPAVTTGVPAALAPSGKSSEPTNRLELARWLTSRDNPLTARVIVNHLWRLVFGSGLVRTPEDFGVQGERPTHPELLDALAIELVESGWDVKRMLKLMVCSATYRQSSTARPADWERDPENQLLARGARYRLPSWMIRDAVLKASGLLNPTLGGPPVYPYQPTGVWADITMGRFHYQPSVGPARYRRTVYAFWRRSAAPAFLFDSAKRRVCQVSTPQTNTPLQALTLLNDLTLLEAARALACQQVLQHASATAGDWSQHEIDSGAASLSAPVATASGATTATPPPVPAESEPVTLPQATAQRVLRAVWQRILSRPPTATEAEILDQQYAAAARRYAAQPQEAAELLAQGQATRLPHVTRPQLAALTVVASMVFNLDEAITRE